jgi:5'-nucleotidase
MREQQRPVAHTVHVVGMAFYDELSSALSGKRLRLLVDMDGVIANWGLEFDRTLDAVGEDGLSIPRHMHHRDWDLTVGLSEPEQQILRSVMNDPGFYRRLEPVGGAKEALEAALDAGHDVHIVTAPYLSNPTCASDKLGWIEEHFGSDWLPRVVISTDKTLVHGDLLFDDKPKITGSMTPSWVHVLFGNYAYNRDVPGLRLNGWDDFVSMLGGAK